MLFYIAAKKVARAFASQAVEAFAGINVGLAGFRAFLAKIFGITEAFFARYKLFADFFALYILSPFVVGEEAFIKIPP